MAGVFDIELHDGDATNQDESDDDVIENNEVRVRFRSMKTTCNDVVIDNL